MSTNENELMLRILVDIQTKLAEHSKRFDTVDGRLAKIERRLDEVHETLYTSFGIAGHANVKTDMLQRELEELRDRVTRLEEKA
ncbi:hypothetical protein [Prosthecodimorpha staleyi]|uniref:Uncharacterized protein n=1 Tax=Prosthecodimorpha staleyi TaxID=2840188 RepID=A0A947D475_9HYPH|nr:hypothetical protein [Prosthecodimorpha staleyi]MBT9287842.1 hypothetical protein [Prosthecodimorpha staleyi]